MASLTVEHAGFRTASSPGWGNCVVNDSFTSKLMLEGNPVMGYSIPLCGSRKYPYSPHRSDWKFPGGWGVL